MADPRGGRREKVKINENSSSAGAIEKLPGAARGCEVGFETCWREYFFSADSSPYLTISTYVSLSVLHLSSCAPALLSAPRPGRIPRRVPRCANSTAPSCILPPLSSDIGSHCVHALLHCRNCERNMDISKDQERYGNNYLFIYNIRTNFATVKLVGF